MAHGTDDTYEIWKLVDKGQIAPILEWLCLHPPKRKCGQTRPFDRGRSFYFGADVKKSKLSKSLLQVGDLIVVDLTINTGVAHYVPKKLLGTGGDIYIRRVDKAKKADDDDRLYWKPLKVQSLGQSSKASSSKSKGGTRLIGKVPDFIKRIPGQEDAIIAVRPILGKTDWNDRKGSAKDLLTGKGKGKEKKKDRQDKKLSAAEMKDALSSYAYTAIRGKDETKLGFMTHEWNVVKTDKEGEEKAVMPLSPKGFASLIESEQLDRYNNLAGLDPELLQERIDDLYEASIHWRLSEEDESAFRDVVDAAKALFEEATPSALPGSTAAWGALNTAMSELQSGSSEAFDTLASTLGQSGFEDAGTLLVVAQDIVKIVQLARTRDSARDVTLKQAVTDLVDHTAKLGTGLTKLSEVILTMRNGADCATVQGLSQGGAIVGCIIGYANAARMGCKAWRTGTRVSKLAAVRREIAAAIRAKTLPLKREAQILADYIFNKMQRRERKQWSTVLAGSFSATAGLMTAIFLFTAINAWNPLGWGLLVAGSAIGLGVVLYTSIRHFTKRHRRKHRLKHKRPGTVDQFTDRALALMLNDKADEATRDFGYKMLRIFLRKKLQKTWQTGSPAIYRFYIKSSRDYVESHEKQNGKWVRKEIPVEAFDYVRVMVKRHVKK